ncbi:hypothetical protein ABMA28_009740 [Loxostege sticticalis]|uniref:Cathepsin propeptide inhibitor domain-containing protein n=1 Tax=Loxostege sticticalis TaxID=481309 RepID=A0ABD0SCA4_LOXSC
MKLICVIFISVCCGLVNAAGIYFDLRDTPYLFLKFVKEYDRAYKNTEDIYVHFAAFTTRLADINKKNMESSSATFGINKFTDYTDEELNKILGVKTKRSKYL